MITKPFKMDLNVAPEMKKIKKLPFTISNKCNLWSLGNITYIFNQAIIMKKNLIVIMVILLLEKIFFFRKLEFISVKLTKKNPVNRFSFINLKILINILYIYKCHYIY